MDAQAGKPIEVALVDAANEISANPVLRGLAKVEPAALAAVGRIDASAPGWQVAHDSIAGALAVSGRDGADIVERWLASFVLSPARPATIASDVAILLAGLPIAAQTVTAHDPLSA